MTFDLTGERVEITVEDGPTISVGPILAWPIYYLAVSRSQAYLDAKDPAAELAALTSLYELFVNEAQPSWDIRDHKGRIPCTAAGMLRLPLSVSIPAIQEWVATAVPKPSAVDATVPPGPVRDALNAGLRAAKRKSKG